MWLPSAFRIAGNQCHRLACPLHLLLQCAAISSGAGNEHSLTHRERKSKRGENGSKCPLQHGYTPEDLMAGSPRKEWKVDTHVWNQQKSLIIHNKV